MKMARNGFWVLAILALGCDGESGFVASEPDQHDTGNTSMDEDAELTSESVDGADATGLVFPEASTFENGCVTDEDCASGSVCSAEEGLGACADIPSDVGAVSDPKTQELVGGAEPNLDCIGASLPVPEESSVATLYGIVDRFGKGLVTNDILIRVYDANEFRPWVCDSKEGADYLQCINDVVEDEESILGEAVSTPVELVEVSACDTDGDCPRGYSCCDGDFEGECCLNFGEYELDGIPVDHPLVILARPANEDDAGDWHSSYLFNTAVRSEYVTDDGRYRLDPLIVGHGQWKTVPSPFFTTIKTGNGAVGGRIRDCGDVAEDRKAWNLYEATVGFATMPDKIGYFNDKEEDSLPDPNRTSTNIHGRYTGLDIVPGPNIVSGALRIGDTTVSLGAVPIYVFPNSLSVVSLPGTVPTITQE